MLKLLSLSEVLSIADIRSVPSDPSSETLDLTILVTLRLNGLDAHAAMFYVRNCGLDVFDVRPSEHMGLTGHIEFRTFEYESVIRNQFKQNLAVA